MIVKIKTINYDKPKFHPFSDPFTQARSEQAVELTQRDNRRAKAAIVLAYGSFGLDVGSKTVGVDSIITTYIRLAERYERRHAEIKNRFNDM